MSEPLNLKPVNEKDMYRVAILALRQLIRKQAFDANMVKFGFLWETNLTAYRTCRNAKAAIAFFEKKLKDRSDT